MIIYGQLVLIFCLIVAIPLFHLYTFFTEVGVLDQWKGKMNQAALIFLFLFTGTLFIYFISPSARIKGLIQLAMVAVVAILLLLI